MESRITVWRTSGADVCILLKGFRKYLRLVPWASICSSGWCASCIFRMASVSVFGSTPGISFT